jgi:ComF family protein
MANSLVSLVTSFLCAETCRWCGQLIEDPKYASGAICGGCDEKMSHGTPQPESVLVTFEDEMSIYSGIEYGDIAKKLLYRFKYDGDLLIGVRFGAALKLAWDKALEQLPEREVYYLAPVPLHWWRVMKRGFNQSEFVSAQLISLLRQHAPYAPTQPKLLPGALKRVKRTKAHHDLGREERFANVADAFRACPRTVEGKDILIVDDVYTTGATLKECARELLASGAASVNAITVARAIMENV